MTTTTTAMNHGLPFASEAEMITAASESAVTR